MVTLLLLTELYQRNALHRRTQLTPETAVGRDAEPVNPTAYFSTVHYSVVL
jgi:hypothetical protein